MRTVGKTHKIIAGAFVFLYLAFFTNNTVFMHTHRSQSGTVTHSHPYKSPSHTHSTDEFQIIPESGSFIALAAVAISVVHPESASRIIAGFRKKLSGTDGRRDSHPRAPPVTDSF